MIHKATLTGAPSRQQGVALFVTLVMVVVMLLILASISYQQQLDFKRSEQLLISDQVVLLALSGESWSKKILQNDAEDNESDSLDDDWAQTIPVMPVEGGWLTGCIIDLQSRFNLNNLGGYDTETFEADLTSLAGSHVDTYLNLLALLELDSIDDRAAVIVDWIDNNDELVAPGGAEDADYSIEDPPRLSANSKMTDLSELVTIKGYSSSDLSVINPFVAVLPSETRINVNTASRETLLALLNGLDEFIADAIIENRPFETPEEFYQLVANETGYMTMQELKVQLPDTLVDVKTNYFELNARVSLAGIEMGLRSLLYRESEGQVKTLSRTFEYLPRLDIKEGQTDPLASPCTQVQQTEIAL